MKSPTDSAAWRKLQAHSELFSNGGFRLGELVREPRSNGRGGPYTVELKSLLFDYSKNLATDETLELLLALAEDCGLQNGIAAMFAGDRINTTERRAALHVALREQDISRRPGEVTDTLNRMERLVQAVHGGDWTGYDGRAIADVVNIGIGGSDLGPSMAVEALKSFDPGRLNMHFVSNIDPSHLTNTLATLDPATTLFIVASKSFGTLETLENAQAAKSWLLASADGSATSRHFIAVSSNLRAAIEFGIAQANVFPMWDWVGGRFSLWSAIGLPIALAAGMGNFRDLLRGAYAMDRHFAESAPAENIPVLMALLAIWYRSWFGSRSSAVVPYSQDLAQFPGFLQQLTMESLGKSVHHDGSPVTTGTGTVTWGTSGTNGQHSYFQLLHQGTEFIEVDFIAFARQASSAAAGRHRHLLANCLSQSMALMDGTPDEANPHKRVAGNRPSNVFLFSELNPFNLGMLIAAYEHKTYVQAVIWNINAFDQWGVELGKKLSSTVFAAFDSPGESAALDRTTQNLISWAKRKQS